MNAEAAISYELREKDIYIYIYVYEFFITFHHNPSIKTKIVLIYFLNLVLCIIFSLVLLLLFSIELYLTVLLQKNHFCDLGMK